MIATIAAVHTVERGDIDGLLSQCVETVLETMFFSTASPRENPPPVEDEIHVTVDFSGSLDGRFSLWLEKNAAVQLAADFLGAETSQVAPEQACETALELANMICGSVVSRIQSDQAFTLAAPKTIARNVGIQPCLGAKHFDLETGWLSVAIELA